MFLKFLVFLFFIYLLFRVVGFFFKVMRTVSGAKQQQANFNRNRQNGQRSSNYGPQSRKYQQPADGNVNIDYIPEEEKKKGKGPHTFKGGEYVDYEDIKE